MGSQSELALTGGTPAVAAQAPAWPVAGEQEAAWMAEVVRSGKWSWLGPHERAFCEEYKAFIGTRYCLCLANGTVTLQCALQAVGVEPGDEVLVPALTWVATAQAAMDIGANVVFVDIDPVTLCMDPAAMEAAITPRTKAAIPVHLYGCMCDMDAIGDIAKRRGLRIVEDVAHQHGSQWRGVCAGALGDAGSFSFQQSKVLTSGEGGAVTCNDKEVYETCFALKQVGWRPGNVEEAPYDDLVQGNRYGHNYRITEMQAVLLRGGLSRLPEQMAHREESAAYLAERLEAAGGPLQAVKRDARVTRQSYYCMTFFFDPGQAGGVTRDMYCRALAAEGAGLGATYGVVYRNPLLNLYDRTSPIPYRDAAAVQDYARLELPNAERACAETAVLMSHTHLLGDRAYLDGIVAAVDKVNGSLAAVRAHFEADSEARG
ncbi:MAG: DegT/DnrJ/EryC1/StrS family aminotransferase [Candidatus Hydrogenedentes bacterium]|nr:DegT/DnrJ/EryC1/StrS family aminotransferase [Candidatus Hydrogenedentota bacterium]